MLACPICRRRFADDGICLACPSGCNSLLRTVYREPHAALDASATGIGQFHTRLPGNARTMTTPLPVLMRLPWLSALYPHLDIQLVFSGWWPARSAFMPSGSFKDLEAAAVLGRMHARPNTTLVLASAGNTAAAFAAACTQLDRPCVIVVAEEALTRIRIPEPQGRRVQIIAITGGAAYDDAIALSRTLVDDEQFVLEGGVRNVARRDGMGIALGVALEAELRMPDAYVQAIGSAAGAIAVLETAEKARERYPSLAVPKLALSQNAPFAPVTRSYARRSRIFMREPEAIARFQMAHLIAPVLTNMAPPYEVAGGIYDSLQKSNGEICAVSNAQALEMWQQFYAHERVELDGAAAVALASIAAFKPEFLPQGSRLLVHLTGGKASNDLERAQVPLTPTLSIPRNEARLPEAGDKLRFALQRNR